MKKKSYKKNKNKIKIKIKKTKRKNRLNFFLSYNIYKLFATKTGEQGRIPMEIAHRQPNQKLQMLLGVVIPLEGND